MSRPARRGRRWPPHAGLAARSVAATCLLAALVGLAFAVLVVSLVGVRRAIAELHEARVTALQARAVEGLLLDAQDGQRAFLVTGQNQFLQPWESARKAFPGQAQELVRASVIPGQRRLAQQISQDGESYFRDYSVPLVDAARRGDPRAHSMAATDEGRRRVGELRAQFGRYDTAGAAVVAARQGAENARASRAVAVASAGLAGSIVLILTVNGYLLARIVRPIRRAAAATTRLGGGDLSVRLPENGSGEISELSRGFNAMGASLGESREREQAARRRLRLLYDASMAVGNMIDAEQAAQNLARITVPRFADYATVDLAAPVPPDALPGAGTPAWRRIALAGIRSDPPLDRVGTPITPTASQLSRSPSGDVAFVADLGASPAWRSRDPDHADRLLAYGMHSLIAVPLNAHGVLIGAITFWRSHDTAPFSHDDLADTKEMAAMTAIVLDNATRYDRERATAVALQRSLLPQHLPRYPAVETASSYLPADTQAGVGGDWFDVIPLSGARVALVVGDVVGRGVHAAVTMGQLRTAVRTLADVDLPPDELFTQLDDLVINLAGSDPPGTAGAGTAPAELTVTCLYMIYDPVSCRCTLASAGHPLPFVVTPAGTAELVTADPAPPLGIGGFPFETTELDIAPGSVLAFYTDGLLHSARRDIGQGLAELRSALSRPAASLEAARDIVIGAMLTSRPAEDVALLLARARGLPASHVATWDAPADPEQVARVRTLVTSQLEAWGMAAESFTTTLVASELVTNAIRYGAPPIRLRLIRDTVLICEVSDASTTAPHLRRARSFDEGGRGLLLVAQLTQRWGTRYHTGGKTIWCEQALPADPEPPAGSPVDGG
jgi:CHASE3 domain sensor protein/anti-sigma regulatory factor (Ser/Thr protein kinase)